MEEKITVRRANPDDTATILAVQRTSPEAALWEAADYVRALREAPTVCLLAEDLAAGRVIGFLLGRMAADELEILNLAVRPEYRRRGVGRRVVARALEFAQAQAASRCWLEVRSANHPARAFYRAVGFAENGCRPRYYCDPEDDAVVCVRRLA